MAAIVQINFSFDMPTPDYNKLVTPLAEPIAAVDGLLWKVWLMNEAAHEAGGIYLFEDAAAAQAYLQGPIVTQLGQHPQIRNVSAKVSGIDGHLTAITRGPLQVTTG